MKHGAPTSRLIMRLNHASQPGTREATRIMVMDLFLMSLLFECCDEVGDEVQRGKWRVSYFKAANGAYSPSFLL